MAVVPFEFGGLFQHPTAYDALRYSIDTVAAIGLIGYAFSRQMGPRAFWRVFAPVFILFSLVIFVGGLPRMFANMRELSYSPMLCAALASLLAIAIVPGWFMAVGLMRHGGWVRDGAGEPLDLKRTFR